MSAQRPFGNRRPVPPFRTMPSVTAPVVCEQNCAQGHAVGRYALRSWLRRCGLRGLSTRPQRPRTQPLTPDDPKLIALTPKPGSGAAVAGYRVQVAEAEIEARAWFAQLREAVTANAFAADKTAYRTLHALHFLPHLYQPLLALDSRPRLADVSPVALNKGERTFIEDLRHHYQLHPEFFADKALYLLRNLSRGRGVGFFEAGNFYPDFLLWLQVGSVQHLVFVDPKGLRHTQSHDPKLSFYQPVREIESRPALKATRPDVHLHAFLLTATRLAELAHLGTATPNELAQRHILLQEEDRDSYIARLYAAVLAAT